MLKGVNGRTNAATTTGIEDTAVLDLSFSRRMFGNVAYQELGDFRARELALHEVIGRGDPLDSFYHCWPGSPAMPKLCMSTALNRSLTDTSRPMFSSACTLPEP